MSNLVEVSKEHFYKAIGQGDIVVTSLDREYSSFQTRSQLEVGRVYATDKIDSNYRRVHRHLLTESFFNETKKLVIEKSFTLHTKNCHLLDSFKNFSDAFGALRKRHDAYYVLDNQGYKYFSDGTGNGFSLLLQSNEGCQQSSWGRYNQKGMELGVIKRIAQELVWDGRPKSEVKDYFTRIRTAVSAGKFKIRKTKK